MTMSLNWKTAAAAVAWLMLFIGALSVDGRAIVSAAYAADSKYQFELAGPPKKTDAGTSIVSVRLIHLPDKKPVPKAVIFESKADMGPAGMAMMGAPVKALPESEPGVYPFEIAPGMGGNWALNLAAKVQGEMDTVRGSVTVALAH
jgi:hypothetical protein